MKTCFFKYLIIAPTEEGRGYDLGLYRCVEKYLIEQGVTEVTLNKVTRVPMWKTLGFRSTTSNQNEAGVNWVGSMEGRTPQYDGPPRGIVEVPVRIVVSDDDPSSEDHLFAWYRADNGAAVAKGRLTIKEIG